MPLLVLVVALPLTADAGQPKPSIFEGYPTPARILRGLAMAESSGNARAVGDDGISEGGLQLNRRYRAERVWWWGAFDPYNLVDSIRITSRLFQANMRALLANEHCIDPSTWERRREDLAIAAHRQGLRGALEHGIGWWYVERVRKAGA
jgi:hypothetical protein